jgi:hypothetical protein
MGTGKGEQLAVYPSIVLPDEPEVSMLDALHGGTWMRDPVYLYC